MEITSVNNDLVKEYSKLQQKKYRNLTGKFILEGYKAIKEAFDFGIEIESVFVDKNRIPDYGFCNNVISTNEAVLKKLSTTETPPQAVAIARQKIYSPEIFKSLKKVILLENISDLGNLGTIIRTSVAFGVEGIILYGQSADIYNPKCVRSSVGNLWKIPIINIDNIETLKIYFSEFTRVATLPRSNNFLKNFKLQLPILVMFGSEADGLSDELIKFSTDDVKIEMSDNVESLNLAVSFSVISYCLFN